MNKRRQTVKYVVSDFLLSALVWCLFSMLRYKEIAQYEGFDSLGEFLLYYQVLKGQMLIPCFWLILYYLLGYYKHPFGKSRIHELYVTFISVTIGVTCIFFVVILNDLPKSFEVYYTLFFSFYALQFFVTYLCRAFISAHARRKTWRGEWVINLLVIGCPTTQMRALLQGSGYHIVGVVLPCKPEDDTSDLPENYVGDIDALPSLMETSAIDELLLIPEPEKANDMISVLYSLYHYKRPIKLWAEKNNPLSKKVRMQTVHGLPLIDFTTNNFSPSEKNIKWLMDKLISASVLCVLSPLYAYIAYRVKKGSSGAVFFKQARIGYMGKPFVMYKFRTMYQENNRQEPLLTDKNDPRVTPFGRFLRKYRLDELPQFWNVLKGDMALVGPRPEQRYYIDQIVQKAPYYYLLHNVRPGITSWGMVKYGYAETVDKMIERLDYDMLYYENMSLTLDITILIYTVKTVVTGRGV